MTTRICKFCHPYASRTTLLSEFGEWNAERGIGLVEHYFQKAAKEHGSTVALMTWTGELYIDIEDEPDELNFDHYNEWLDEAFEAAGEDWREERDEYYASTRHFDIGVYRPLCGAKYSRGSEYLTDRTDVSCKRCLKSLAKQEHN
ncbi:hypothetical protein [Cupriavidus taiwanensis]|uniref:hypothetical protein n=1 Tax=Cupriavidus taiwanensis TaxID=164546 RepID=UPI000E101DF4|nr:hypothetical protein [Cupriavidus taiwanensis]SOY48498.1 hypothetical protein CBM2592_A190004 [Cupriavidus taiwanensis]SOY83027.1 hypothetical protein CBM2591_A230005 [Cupriavidus taiwanensis]SOZ56195.1 hypothetical protein CBM2617_A200011 [Cupriavidus taiwanensis]SOZ78796.1 hypothetical protein CBM2618_A180011 [Cupriavidus taiwanensis]SOZ79063.1 hypothetical protein CBM2622_A170010 [Cupriavidus taiwanensis]